MQHDVSWLDTAGRLLVVAYYVMQLLHDVRPGPARQHIARLKGFNVPFPAAVFCAAIALELAGCALLLSGWHVEIGIYCLIVFTVVASGIYNRAWLVQTQVGRFFSPRLLGAESAVLGVLLLLLANLR